MDFVLFFWLLLLHSGSDKQESDMKEIKSGGKAKSGGKSLSASLRYFFKFYFGNGPTMLDGNRFASLTLDVETWVTSCNRLMWQVDAEKPLQLWRDAETAQSFQLYEKPTLSFFFWTGSETGRVIRGKLASSWNSVTPGSSATSTQDPAQRKSSDSESARSAKRHKEHLEAHWPINLADKRRRSTNPKKITCGATSWRN